MAGIYIHIPFCKQQCSYCDFHFSTTFEAYRKEMIDAICDELNSRAEYLEKRTIETIYFGGGTPSLLNEAELRQIFSTINKRFELSDELEVTLEANPDDILENRLVEWKKFGINRLSIGIQSFKAEDLEWMNRAHTVDEGENCVQLANKYGFDNLTVDLMYGLPNLTNEEWRNHVQKVIDLEVNHISAYCLTIEEKTALNNWVKKGKIVPASEDQQSEQFMILLDTLEKANFHQYEISNFAKEGHESIHNSNYWKGKWYLGVGPSAHSFNGNSRQWNVANNQRYIQAVNKNEVYWEEELLSKEDQFNERILTGLRMAIGLLVDDLETILPIPKEQLELVKALKAEGLMENRSDVWQLTKQGRLKADWIAAELFIA